MKTKVCPAAKLVGRRFKDNPEYQQMLTEAREQAKAEQDADYDAWTQQIKDDIKRFGEEELLRRLAAPVVETAGTSGGV